MNVLKAVQLEGRDGEDFLQRVTSVWVKKLLPGNGAKGLLLNGTAKVIAPFFLLRPVAERFLLLTHDRFFSALCEGLESLHFAEDFSLTKWEGAGGITKENIHGTERFSEKDHQPNQDFFPIHVDGEEIVFPFPIPGFFGYYSGETITPVTEEEFERERIQAMFPVYGKEWTEDSNALDVGFLPWIHRGKGCYPGQEVVERSLNLGHPARSLVLLEADFSLQIEDSLLVDDKKVGTVTSAFAESALGIVQWKHRGADTVYQVRRQETFLGEARCRK